MPPLSFLENPFVPPRKRNPDDAELVGKILGPEEEKAMREALGEVGKPKPKGPEPKEGDIQMSEEELRVVEAARKRELERKEGPEQKARTRFIAWAEEFGLGDEDWIAETFQFHPDGSVTVERDLNLHRKGITYLPKGWREIGGDLDLSWNQITSLEGLPEKIGEDLYLNSNKITSLEGLPREIGVGLWLTKIPATEIPEHIRIYGKIHVAKNQTALAEDIEKKYPGKLQYSD